MILIGTMNWTKTIAQGEFHCPNCNTTRQYQRKSFRPFLTLYFIPVIPLGKVGDFVRCRSCRVDFAPEILTQPIMKEPPSSQPVAADGKGLFEYELLRVMAMVITEDANISATELQTAARVFSTMTEKPVTGNELTRACREVIALRINPERYLTRLSDSLTYDQKLLLIQAMFLVAGCEGSISAKRMDTLIKSGQLLKIDPKEFQTIIQKAEQWL